MRKQSLKKQELKKGGYFYLPPFFILNLVYQRFETHQ